MEGGDRLRSRLASLRCTTCGGTYRDGHVRIRAEREAIAFVDVVCRTCGGEASAIATLVSDGEHRTFLELGELDELQAPGVGIGDVLAMSEFLADFEGDFRTLFGHGEPSDVQSGA